MKIAISSDEDTLKSKVDQRFGRSEYFLIVNIEGDKVGTFEAIKNQGAIQGHGAGIKAAQQIGELKVETVITGQLGPNATTVLKQLGIKAYSASGVITDVLKEFVQNKLKEINEVAKAHNGETTAKEKSTERIYFPLLENKGVESKISDHFGHAPFFGLYDTKLKELTITKNDLDHTDGTKSPVDQIVEAVNPTTVFALGIGARAIQLFNEKGISLKTGECRTVQEAIDNFEKLGSQTSSCGHTHPC